MKKLSSLFLCVIIISFSLKGQQFTQVEHVAHLDQASRNNGVSVADFDQDGDLDVFLVGFYSYLPFDTTTWNRLFRNEGDGTFTDVTMEAGFDQQYVNLDARASLGEKMGASWGDYDNDGYPDLYLTNSREDQLYHNQGDGTFIDVSQAAGLGTCHDCYSSSALWWDHDRDGDLDLYVSVLNGPNIMYQNNADGTFTDITAQTGLGGVGVTWTSVAIDVNQDGYLDLLTINDTQANELWESRQGLFFENVALAYRMADEGAGMGVTIGDYNNDGKFDVYITQIYNYKPNPLLRNDGRRFTDRAFAMDVADSGWGWGTHFLDYDHDGDEDIFAVNGVVSKQTINGSEQQDEAHFFFHNNLMEGSLGFENIAEATGTDKLTRARGLEVFDYDNDGDLDMLVGNVEHPPYLFRNETIQDSTPSDKNWLKLNLKGTISNRDAYGTRLQFSANSQQFHRYYHGAGFYSQSSKGVHLGLGSISEVEEIIVYWPSGNRDTLLNIAANQNLSIEETPRDPSKTLLAPVASFQSGSYGAPNPFETSTRLIVDCPRSGTLSVKIFNQAGQLIFTEQKKLETPQKVVIPWGDGSGVPAGLYYYKADLDNQIEDVHYQGKMLKIGGQ